MICLTMLKVEYFFLTFDNTHDDDMYNDNDDDQNDDDNDVYMLWL